MSDSGNLYVVSAPSGTGKTTLVSALIESLPKITVSISHTTRHKRSNERHGIDYYFIDHDEFNRMIARDDFLEHAVIFGQQYGTSKQWVKETLAKGIDVILEIDWQGYLQVKALFETVIGVFILPPSWEILRERLIKRDQDNPTIIKKRLADAMETVSHIGEFHYVIVNDDFMDALEDLRTIVKSGRLLKDRQINKHSSMINDLLHMPTEP